MDPRQTCPAHLTRDGSIGKNHMTKLNNARIDYFPNGVSAKEYMEHILIGHMPDGTIAVHLGHTTYGFVLPHPYEKGAHLITLSPTSSNGLNYIVIYDVKQDTNPNETDVPLELIIKQEK